MLTLTSNFDPNLLIVAFLHPFSSLRDSSKAVVNSLLSTKDLDLHLLTSRVAGMSCPTDGMDLSSYKNSIDDIRQILEARHAGHYAVFNLCEKGRITLDYTYKYSN